MKSTIEVDRSDLEQVLRALEDAAHELDTADEFFGSLYSVSDSDIEALKRLTKALKRP